MSCNRLNSQTDPVVIVLFSLRCRNPVRNLRVHVNDRLQQVVYHLVTGLLARFFDPLHLLFGFLVGLFLGLLISARMLRQVSV